MDCDTVTRAFTLPTETLRKLEWAAERRNSPIDNTLSAAINTAIMVWIGQFPTTFVDASKGSNNVR